MNATDTRPAPQRTERWTAPRVFRIALAITFGILTALVVVLTLFYLLFGPSGGGAVGSDGLVDEQVVEHSPPGQ